MLEENTGNSRVFMDDTEDIGEDEYVYSFFD